MTERSNVIHFPVERRDRTTNRATNLRRLLASYAYHAGKLEAIRAEMGVQQEPEVAHELRREELAALAMRVCDLVLASQETTGAVHAEQIAESLVAIRAYEELRGGDYE